jgi:hypothetical protein
MSGEEPSPKTHYWFPAKRYGWGCGPPSTRQGWVVLGVYVGLPARSSMPAFSNADVLAEVLLNQPSFNASSAAFSWASSA